MPAGHFSYGMRTPEKYRIEVSGVEPSAELRRDALNPCIKHRIWQASLPKPKFDAG